MTGAQLWVVGIGPGRADWLVPEAAEVLASSTDLVGYQTYLDLVPAELLTDQRRHGSDNRVELERAELALQLACDGARVAVVSSGDPGVFAMASAVFEAQLNGIREGRRGWADIDVVVVPGVTAALSAAAVVGAPLGHDFCTISLSDNLKPWSVIEERVRAALAADFVMALYNPLSKARPHQFGRVVELISQHRHPDTPVVFARDVGRPDERIIVSSVADAAQQPCDMRTVVVVGSSTTVAFEAAGRTRVFTPRSYG